MNKCACGFEAEIKYVSCPMCGIINNEEEYIAILKLRYKLGHDRDY